MLSQTGVVSAIAGMSAFTGFSLSSWLTAKVTLGQCSHPTSLVDPWDPEQYLGVWYELRRTKDIRFFDEDDECVTVRYEANPRGTIAVTNNAFKAYYDSSVTPAQDEATAHAEISSW